SPPRPRPPTLDDALPICDVALGDVPQAQALARGMAERLVRTLHRLQVLALCRVVLPAVHGEEHVPARHPRAERVRAQTAHEAASTEEHTSELHSLTNLLS